MSGLQGSRSRGARAWLPALFALAGIGIATAQTPLPRAAPNLRLVDSGMVYDLARQPDGGVVVGGYFVFVNGVPRVGVARLRPDATLDLDWDARNNGSITQVAIGPDGAIFIAGNFNTVGERSRTGVAKLHADGTLDTAWQSPIENSDGVEALAVGPDGAVYVGGALTVAGGTRRLLKLDGATGALEAGWPAAGEPNDYVFDLAVDGDALYVGGRFVSIGGAPRTRLARLAAASGALDAGWHPLVGDQVHGLATDGLGHLYVAGFFSTAENQARRGLAKFDAQGRLDPDWNPSQDGLANTVAIAEDGAILVGGRFDHIGGAARGNVARLSALSGNALPGFEVAFSGSQRVHAVATLGTPATLLIGGDFTDVAGAQHLALMQVDAAGPTPTRLGVGVNAILQAFAEQADGSLIVGGQFLSVDEHDQRYLLRLRPDGSFDQSWRPRLDGSVRAIAIDSHDDVYIGGHFATVDGQDTRYLAKLEGATARRVAWSPAPAGRVYALALDGQDQLYVGGDFASIGGAPRGRAARYTRDLALTSWNPGLGDDVYAILPSAAGIYLGSETGLGRFALADGARDAGWNPLADGQVLALAADELGRVYAGGDYTRIGGAARRSLARLDPASAAADAQWTPTAAGDYAVVRALANDGQGALYAAGTFYRIGGLARAHLAKLALAGGTAETTWNPSPDLSLYAVHAMRSGDIAAGGAFRSMGKQRRDGLAVLPRIHRERTAQRIVFATPAPGPFVLGTDASAVQANASSGLPVRYGSLTPTLCDIDAASGQIVLLGAGTCIASAEQDGDEDWLPAPQATQGIVIEKAPQAALALSIAPSTLQVGERAALATTGGSGIGEVAYAVSAGAATCEILPPATLRAAAAGDCTVTATKAGDHDHLPISASAAAHVLAPLPDRVFGNGFE